VISGYEGSKPRTVLIQPSELPRVLNTLGERGDAVAADTGLAPASAGEPAE
jgi:hypothetical protein